MELIEYIEQNKKEFIELSDKIWEFAEVAYTENKSADETSKLLEKNGFDIKHGIASIPSAFVAEFGSGYPIIAVLGEMDALPGISQTASPFKESNPSSKNGHGCGHNLLGVSGAAGVIAIKQKMEEEKLTGTIRYYACPAEENGSGKTFMVKAGVFDDVDLALTWHPSPFTGVFKINMLANMIFYIRFRGRTAHAAADPYNGRSALDALELTNVGLNYLREHVISDARIHYITTNGGEAPNIVPEHAEGLYTIRSPKGSQLLELYERVKKVAKGAAMMTETEVEFDFHSAMSNLIFNNIINEVLKKTILKLGKIDFSPEDYAYAKEIIKSFDITKTLGMFAGFGINLDMIPQAVLDIGLLPQPIIFPESDKEIIVPGSSDVGDISWNIPTGQFGAACQVIGTPGHSWQITAQSGMGIGHKGMLHAAKILALSGLEFLKNPDLVKKAKEEFNLKVEKESYVSPIPEGSSPPIPK